MDWLKECSEDAALLPSNPFTKAIAYTLKRRAELEVFLSHPEVDIDTNHVERGNQLLAMGRKNYLFAWTELGAKEIAGNLSSFLDPRDLPRRGLSGD